MAGYNRTINKIADKTENAQCRIDKDMHDIIVERARSEGVSAAYYYRRWLIEGFKKEAWSKH